MALDYWMFPFFKGEVGHASHFTRVPNTALDVMCFDRVFLYGESVFVHTIGMYLMTCYQFFFSYQFFKLKLLTFLTELLSSCSV